MTDGKTIAVAGGFMLAKNTTMGYIHSNETPRASACMRTQRGSFFAPTNSIQGPTP